MPASRSHHRKCCTKCSTKCSTKCQYVNTEVRVLFHMNPLAISRDFLCVYATVELCDHQKKVGVRSHCTHTMSCKYTLTHRARAREHARSSASERTRVHTRARIRTRTHTLSLTHTGAHAHARTHPCACTRNDKVDDDDDFILSIRRRKFM